MSTQDNSLIDKINLLNQVGIALSSEKNFSSLLEQILIGAKQITNADGGTIYLLDNDDQLEMVVVQTDSLDIHLGGNTDKPISFKPIRLYNEDGSKNLNMVVTRTVHEEQSINIEDAYATDADGYDFSGTYEFDKNTGYRSTSFLAVPMMNHENDVIGVLQLLNAQDDDGNVVSFSEQEQHLVESLASQAAVAITNKQLIDSLNELFNALVQLIATAIDEKSPYTSGHCKRLPIITMLLAEAAHETADGELKEFQMDEADRYELEVAAWLHDCGKLTTPEYVMDKATKLEKIFDRIHLLDARVEVLKRDAEIEKLQSIIRGIPEEQAEKTYQARIKELSDMGEALRRHNKGGEFMHEDDINQVKEWGNLEWKINGETQPFLNEDEIKNLTIAKGTLSHEEREIINNHIVATIKMLDTLPFPKHLKNVPEYAGGHHERMDGKGYPLGLKKEDMSVQARIMAIADVFEALTARDRPYKEPMKLSLAVSILKNMSETGHIDPVLFDAFMNQEVHLKYAKNYLLPEQNDL